MPRRNPETLFSQPTTVRGDRLPLADMYGGETFTLNQRPGTVLRQWAGLTQVRWDGVRSWVVSSLVVTFER